MLNEDILLSILKNNFDKVITIIDEERPCYVETFDVLTITKDELVNSNDGYFIVDSINLKESDEYILEFGGHIIKGEQEAYQIGNNTVRFIEFYDGYIGRIAVNDKVTSIEGMEDYTYNETTAVVSLAEINLPFEEFTDIKLKKLNIKPLSNDLLEKDLVIQNSISLGRVEDSVIGEHSYAVGEEVTASGDTSHAEGYGTNASGHHSHAEGNSTTANGYGSHAEGGSTTANGYYSHAEGQCTTASGYSHAEGDYTKATGNASHAEGSSTTASGVASHAEGTTTTASGTSSHAEGYGTTASSYYSHSEGYSTTASGSSSHAEGYSSNKVTNVITSFSTSTSDDTIITQWGKKKFSLAKGKGSHIEGIDNLALGESSHAEGNRTTASGYISHAEGNGTTASGDYSHTEGKDTKASGICSHAEGYFTKASGKYQHVQGKYNIEDTTHKYAHIVGNGNSTARSNAHTLDWDGNAWFKGNVSIDGTPTNDKDLTTKQYIDNHTLPMYIGTENNPVDLSTVPNGWSIIDGHFKWYSEGNAILAVKKLIHKSPVGKNFYVTYMNGAELTRYSVNMTSKEIKSYRYPVSQQVLERNNTLEYTPTEDYNPATKKYVDDKFIGINLEIVGTIPQSELQRCNDGTSRYISSVDFDTLFSEPNNYLYYATYKDDTLIPIEYDTEYNRMVTNRLDSVDGVSVNIGFDYGTHKMYPFNGGMASIKAYTFTNDLIIKRRPILNADMIATKEYVDKHVGNRIITANNVNDSLTLTTNKLQYTTLTIPVEVILPTVTEYTEIHLFFNGSEGTELNTTNVKWESQLTIENNKSYEVVFTYVNDVIGWLAKTVVYS